MRNVIPITCGLAIIATVIGVKVVRHDTATKSIAWYGNAVHPYTAEVRVGAEAFARDSGEKIYCTIGQEWTQDNENINVEALSVQGYRGFCLYPGDPAGANGLFRLLVSRQQPVVAYGAEPALPTPASFTVATDIRKAAMIATEHLIQCMGGQGKVLNVLEAVTDVNTRKRDEGVRAVVAKHPGVEIIQTISDMIQMGEATTKIQSALAARANSLDGVIATGYNTTVAAAAILTEWHKDARHKRIHFVGIDTDPTVLAAIQSRAIDATIAQNPFGHGYVSCALLAMMNQGWAPRRDYTFIDAGLVVVTRTNLNTYAAEIRQITSNIVAELKTQYLNPPGATRSPSRKR